MSKILDEAKKYCSDFNEAKTNNEGDVLPEEYIFNAVGLIELMDAARKDEREVIGFVRYIKSEYDQQIKRMAALGINTTGQEFEQMVNTLIFMVGQKRYSIDQIRETGKYCEISSIDIEYLIENLKRNDRP